MAQKTLQAVLVLGGRVDNTFGAIGDSLISLGYTVDQVSSQLINFGKSGLEVYKDYNKNMQELETVWGSNGTFQKNSRELTSAINSMGDAVSEWAANTIFHTNDVSNALVEAAHAGWGYEEMMEGIPAAMSMAQAGGMDLSVALDYVLKAQESFGWSFEDTMGYMDEWIYAANRSAGTAREFGETFLRLGSTVRLADNTEELLALTKVMHDLGSTGSKAGTLIRTSLMRLYAPSGKADEVLKAMGYTAEEIEETGIRVDAELEAALAALGSVGFSAFDETTNQAKPVLQTYAELGEALIKISGYEQEAGESTQQFFERVLKHKTVMGIMSEVFGIRGIQGSMNILMSLNEAMELYNDLTNDAADGTTEYVRSMMDDTLYGQTEKLYSKWENLQLLVGESLAPEFEKLQQFIGGIIDKVAGMDEEKFNAWVNGLKAVAIAGTTLTATGFLMKFVGFALTVPGIISLVSIGAASLVSAMTSLQEADFEGKFGSMNLDAGTLNEYIKTLGTDFNDAYKHVNDFAGALSTAVSNYEEASQTFSSEILNAVLTKTEFTDAEKEKLEQLGISIYGEVLKAIEASSNEAANFWAMLYGGEGVAEADPKYQQILEILNKSDTDAVDQATAIGERVKQALVKGFTSGFTGDDYNEILKAMREYNDLVAAASAQAQAEQQFIEQKKLLHKAQTASLDDVKKIAQDAAAQRESQLALFEEEYLTQKFALEYRNREGILSDEDFANLTAENEKRYQEWVQKTGANYDEFLMTLMETAVRQSDFSESYEKTLDIVNRYLSGEIQLDNLYSSLMSSDFREDASMYSVSNREDLGKFLGSMFAIYGGEDAIREQIAYFEKQGNAEMANRMLRMYMVEQFATNFGRYYKTAAKEAGWDFLGILPEGFIQGSGSDAYKEQVEELQSLYQEGYLKEYDEAIQQKKQEIDDIDKRLKDAKKNLTYAENNLAKASDEWKFTYQIQVDTAQKKVDAIQQELDEALQELEEMIEQSKGFSGAVNLDVEFPGAVDKAASVYSQIEDQFTEIDIPIVLSAFTGTKGKQFKLMAHGGRETQPAIFAEAGIPEWFIPEEHTQNTARLILGAAYGSGFDLYDLAAAAGARMFAEGGTTGSLPSLSWASLSSSGGGGSGEGIKVQYSPVIHAENAAGVKRELAEDKKRFEKWMNEWWEKRNLYQSIVTYQ